MRIGIICAMSDELEYIVNNLSNAEAIDICGLTFHKGNLEKNEVICVMCGIGKVNSAISTTLLINTYKPELIINSGIAGGSHNLQTKDIVIAEKLAYSDVDVEAFGYEFGTVPGMPLYYETSEMYRTILKTVLDANNVVYREGLVLTADTFRLSQNEIKNQVDCDFAVEMEGASIAQACYKLQTPFLSIRIISDILDSENHIQDYNAFERESALFSGKTTIEFINKL